MNKRKTYEKVIYKRKGIPLKAYELVSYLIMIYF